MTKEIKVRDNIPITVDDDTALMIEELLKKRYHSLGYYGRSKKYVTLRIQIPLHHVILGIDNITEGKVIDHINGDSTDNRKDNLRICTQDQNRKNIKPYGKCKYKGVYKIPSGRYQSKISYRENGIKRQVRIGTFDTLEEAAVAYNKTAYKVHGEYAYLNDV